MQFVSHCASICSRFRERSLLFSLVQVAIQAFLFIAPIISVSSTPQNPLSLFLHHMLLAPTHIAIGSSDILFWFFYVFLWLAQTRIITDFFFFPKNHHNTWLYEFIPVYCPVIIWIAINVIKTKNHEVCSYIVISQAAAMWVISILYLPKPYNHHILSLSPIIELARTAIFLIECLTIVWFSKFIAAIIILSFLGVLLIVQYIWFVSNNEQIQYLRMLENFSVLIFAIAIIMETRSEAEFGIPSQSLHTTTFFLVLIVVLERLGFIELLLSHKYLRAFQKDLKDLSNKERIVVFTKLDDLINNKLPTIWNLRFIKSAVSSPLMQEASPKCDEQIRPEAICKLIEKKIEENKDLELIILVSIKYISIGYIMKASICRTLASSLRMNTIEKIKLFTVGFIVDHLQKWESEVNSFQQAGTVCSVKNQAKRPVDLEKIFKQERQLSLITKQVKKVIGIGNNLIKKLLAGNVTESTIVEVLELLSDSKEETQKLVEKYKHLLNTYEGIIAYYLFNNVCRSKKYTLFDILGVYFERISLYNNSGSNLTTLTRNLVCLVSGEAETIGVVMHANNIFRQYFNISQQKLVHKTFKVNSLMPKIFAEHHDQAIMSFRSTGIAKNIGRHRSVFTLRCRDIQKVEVFVSICPFTDGLMFAGSIKPIEDADKYAFYDENGQIQECSINVVRSLKWKSPYPNIFEITSAKFIPQTIIGSLRRSCDTNNSRLTTFRENMKECPVQLYQIPFVQYVGVCKFLEIFRLELGKTLTQLSRTIDFSKQSRLELGGNHINQKNTSTSDNRRFYDMEYSIAMSKAQFKMVPWLKLSYIVVWVTAMFGLYWVNQDLSQSISMTKAMVLVQKSTAPMLRIQSFGLMTSAFILAGIFGGQIPDTVGQRFGIESYSMYTKKRVMYFVEQSGVAQRTIMSQTTSLPLDTILMVNERLFGQASLITLRLNLINQLSFKKSMYYDFFTQEAGPYMASWPVIINRIYWVQNYQTYERVQYMDARQPASISKAVSAITNSVAIQIVCFCSIVVFASGMYFYFFNRLQVQCRNYITLLKYLNADELQAKLLKNAIAEEALNLLQKYSVENVKVHFGQSIMVDVYDRGYQFCKGNVILYQRKVLQQLNPSSKQKRQIQKESLMMRDKFGWIPMVLLLGIALAFFSEALYSNRQLNQALENYFKVSLSVSSLELSEIAFLYIATARYITGGNITLLGRPADQVFDLMKGTIFQRDFQQIFIENSSWANFTDSIFQSNCNPNDPVCSRVLSGAINGGWASSIMQYTTSLLDLYEAVKSPRPYPKQLDASILHNIIELHFSYMQYMRGNIRKFKDFSYSALSSNLNKQIKTRASLLEMVWPILLSVLVILLLGVIRTMKRLRMTIVEIFTIDTIDFLYRNMHFSFQILRL